MNIERFGSPHDANESVQTSINNIVREHADKWFLEAGCGSMSRLELPSDIKLAGIDISQEQVNRYERLNEKYVGDIQSFDFPFDRYHGCICWNVLEHVNQPIHAIDNISKSLAQGAYFIIAIPNVFSLKGLVTKFTPHSFHVWYYKKILGSKSADRPDRAPFETHLRFSLGVKNLKNHLLNKGFVIEKLIYNDSMVFSLKKSHYSLYLIYRSLSLCLKLLSLGKLGGSHNSDFIIIAKKA